MIIRNYIPRPPLSDFVEVFWLYEGFTQPAKERALPTGTVELVLSLRDDRLQVFDRRNTGHSFRGAMICGPHSEFFVTDQIGLNQRHFIQVFRDEVGLTPKLFCRYCASKGSESQPRSQPRLIIQESILARKSIFFNQHYLYSN